MRFAEIIGQQEVKERLVQTVHENRVSHAQLFIGPEGSGKLALALAYAQFISCENRQPADSCGECNSCRKYNRLIHPDLHFSYPFFAKHKEDTATTFIEEWREAFLANPYLDLDDWRNHLDAENKQANINIAECHQIIRKLSMKQFEAEYKVLIMWLPEYLDKAGNTLLKIIEEPPAKTLFLLVAQSSDQILNTIISRTQLVKIPKVQTVDIYQYLLNHKKIDDIKAGQAVYLADGNVNSAFKLLQDNENDNLQMFIEWMRMTYAEWINNILDMIDSFVKLGRENQKNFFKYCISMLRETVLLISGAPNLVHLRDAELNFVGNFSQKMTLGKCEAAMLELEKAHYHIERNANPRILFLDVSLQLVQILKYNTIRQTADTNIYTN